MTTAIMSSKSIPKAAAPSRAVLVVLTLPSVINALSSGAKVF